MHVGAFERVFVDALLDAQIGAVDVDGVVHHADVASVPGENRATAAREVRGVRLGGEEASLGGVGDDAHVGQIDVFR